MIVTYVLISTVYNEKIPFIAQRIRGFLNGMRYINPRFTYLLTYLLTSQHVIRPTSFKRSNTGNVADRV